VPRTPRRRKKLFVTFEGIDGCGKSTQAMLASQLLTRKHYQVKLLREPGSTPVAERIRAILLDNTSSLADTTELLLYEAARAELVTREIVPALRAQQIVLCDRFYDSTAAYQGYGRKLDLRMVRSLHRVAVGDLKPDLTFLFDVDLDTALSRLGKNPDRLESESRAFFRRVRQGFLEIARKERRRVKVIDATAAIDEIFEEVKRYLARRVDLI